jgi:hypothetical protein
MDMVNGGITVKDVQPSMVDFYKRAGYKEVVKDTTAVSGTEAQTVIIEPAVPQDLDPAADEPVKVKKVKK